MTAKLIVGFSTRLATDHKDYVPTFEPDKRLTDPVKIAANIEEKKAAFLANAKDMPYFGTFSSVFISDPANERIGQWNYRSPGGTKVPICQAVRSWVLAKYTWPWDTHPDYKMETPVVFMGFNTRLFLKLLGIECSLPGNNCPLPPSMWYGNTDHRDIEEAIIPKEFKDVTLKTALLFRGIVPKESWVRPHEDPEEDVRITVELCSQLGFFRSK